MANPGTIKHTMSYPAISRRLSVIRISAGTLQHENSSPSNHQQLKEPKLKHGNMLRHHETSGLRACQLLQSCQGQRQGLARGSVGQLISIRWEMRGVCLYLFSHCSILFPHLIHSHFGIHMAVACLPSVLLLVQCLSPRGIIVLIYLLVRLYTHSYHYCFVFFARFCLCFLAWGITATYSLFAHTVFAESQSTQHSGSGLRVEKDKKATETTETLISIADLGNWSAAGTKTCALPGFVALLIPIPPHKAVVEVSQIGNQKESVVVVDHGWQGESTDGSKGGCSFGLSIQMSVYLAFHNLSDYLPTCLSTCVPI